MKHGFLIIAVWFCAILSVLSQTALSTNQTKSLRLARFEKNGVSLEFNELNISADFRYRQFHGNFVIRLCSETPFLILYKQQGPRIGRLLYEFKKFTKIPKDRLILLRSEDCVSNREQVTPIKIWWIKDDEFPPFIEKLAPCQISSRLLEGDLKNDSDYQKGLHHLREEIKLSNTKNKAIGYVRGFYAKRRNRVLTKRLSDARRLLASEIKEGLVKIETVKYKNANSKKSDSFPIISMVEIQDICN